MSVQAHRRSTPVSTSTFSAFLAHAPLISDILKAASARREELMEIRHWALSAPAYLQAPAARAKAEPIYLKAGREWAENLRLGHDDGLMHAKNLGAGEAAILRRMHGRNQLDDFLAIDSIHRSAHLKALTLAREEVDQKYFVWVDLQSEYPAAMRDFLKGATRVFHSNYVAGLMDGIHALQPKPAPSGSIFLQIPAAFD
jgi:hypothetical protein